MPHARFDARAYWQALPPAEQRAFGEAALPVGTALAALRRLSPRARDIACDQIAYDRARGLTPLEAGAVFGRYTPSWAAAADVYALAWEEWCGWHR